MANGLIGKVTAGGGTHLVASTAYFTCATAAGTAAKIAAAADSSLDSITLITGLTIYVKFTNANGVANPTLALYKSDGTTKIVDPVSIKRYGTTAPGTNAATSWRAGAIVALTYDGTNWIEQSGVDDNTTYTVPSAGTTATAVGTTAAGGSATTWSKSDHVHSIALATGDSNGQVKIAGTNVSVKGLGSAAYTDSNAYATSGHNHDSIYVNVSGDTMSGDLLFSDSGTNIRKIQFQMASNDYGRIAVGGTAANAGWMEIATGDDSNEPIYVRQYTGVFTTLKRTFTLLDGSGNTTIPRRLWIGDELGASTNTNNGSQLIISSSASGAGSNVALELWRGSNASWQISNEQGYLHFRNNYTSSKQTTYSVDALKLNYNTGDATFKRNIFGGNDAVFNGSVTVGGNAANTSGARMVYNSTEKTLDFVFA